MSKRVLVSEELAESGLESMRAAGLDVEVRLGLTPEELVQAVDGVAALVIRSATQVTADVLAAGTDLVVVGRAGIGLDNVDVAEATRRVVMVVNAPQSNVLSAAERMFDCGALTTMTPLRVASATSTLSSPMPARPTTINSSAAVSTSAVTCVALRITSACAPLIALRSCSGERSVCTSTSRPAARIASRPRSARGSETSTRAAISRRG